MSTKNPTYAAGHKPDEETGDEVLPEQGSWRPPYGLLAVMAFLVLLVGFGGGFGAGWAAAKDNNDDKSCTVVASGQVTATDVTNINSLRPWQPIDISSVDSSQTSTNDAVATQYAQYQTMNPAMSILSVVVSALNNDTQIIDPNVLKLYIVQKFPPGQSNLLSELYDVAQRLQVSPKYQAAIYNLTTSFMDIFGYIRDNQNKVATSGRHLMAANSATPYYQQLLTAFVRDGLNSPQLRGAVEQISDMWTVDDLTDLVVDMFSVVRQLVSNKAGMVEAAKKWHVAETFTPIDAIIQEMDIFDPASNASLGKIIPIKYNPTVASEDGDDTAASNGRRRLQQGYTLVTEMPPIGVAPYTSQPKLLIPIAFHVFAYRDGGSYGPPGYLNAPASAARLIQAANIRLAPTNVQLFLKDVRYLPDANPYLAFPDRNTWLNCATGDYFPYDGCDYYKLNIRLPSIDFPRTINFFIVGENPPTDYNGYAFTPGGTTDPLGGHGMLTFTTFDSSAGINRRADWEGGANIFTHEVLHHLGLGHVFWDQWTESKSTSCNDEDSGGAWPVRDTPAVQMYVWERPYDSFAYCSGVWQSDSKSNWDVANNKLMTRSAIPSLDQNPSFDTCPGSPGFDEVANYLDYTYDVCQVSLGHLSSQQIQVLHQATATSNPVLYAWGQYYAQNPPPGAAANLASAVPTNPAPTPATPAATPSNPAATNNNAPSCGVSQSNAACLCKRSWEYKGTTYNGCVKVPGEEAKGFWCGVNSGDDCATARNGWWDYCTPGPEKGCSASTTSTNTNNNAGSSSGAGQGCGPSAITKSGRTCAKGKWTCNNCGDNSKQSGCGNPGNSKSGPWCVLAAGQTGPTGEQWDYCSDTCSTGATQPANVNTGSPAGGPQQLCPAGQETGLPTGCSCMGNYGLKFGTEGQAYTTLNGCYKFAEKDQPLCVVKCGRPNKAQDGQGMTCSCGSNSRKK